MVADDDIGSAGPAPGADEAAPAAAAAGSGGDLGAVQAALTRDIDAAIARLEKAPADATTREHLEVLRSLLTAQVAAYLEHVRARRAKLFPHTSVMYAGDVAPPGPLSTTLQGLLEGGTVSGGQAARLAQLVRERRTVLIIGERGVGKSTLLNALFELVPVDDRFVAIEQGPDLPALKERSFCVRLGVRDGTDLPALFGKARRMNPDRLAVGEIHAPEVREFFSLLKEDSHVGGFATLRAESMTHALDVIVAAFGGDAGYARELVAEARPAFAHLLAGDGGRPRLGAIWDIAGLEGGKLVVREMDTGASAAADLPAEV
ncbi:MAG: ATPase, T2SS/T4P/T4SS family [Thermoleophilia bacterium]